MYVIGVLIDNTDDGVNKMRYCMIGVVIGVFFAAIANPANGDIVVWAGETTVPYSSLPSMGPGLDVAVPICVSSPTVTSVTGFNLQFEIGGEATPGLIPTGVNYPATLQDMGNVAKGGEVAAKSWPLITTADATLEPAFSMSDINTDSTNSANPIAVGTGPGVIPAAVCGGNTHLFDLIIRVDASVTTPTVEKRIPINIPDETGPFPFLNQTSETAQAVEFLTGDDPGAGAIVITPIPESGSAILLGFIGLTVAGCKFGYRYLASHTT